MAKAVQVISAPVANAVYFETTPKIKDSFVVWSNNVKYGNDLTADLWPKRYGKYHPTSPSGSRRFKTYQDAVRFGRALAIRMGEKTSLELSGGAYHGYIDWKFYVVYRGKLVME
jgi:hypothetical protein